MEFHIEKKKKHKIDILQEHESKKKNPSFFCKNTKK